MDHGREVAWPTTVGSTNLGMAGAVQGDEAHMSASTFHGQLAAAAARRASFEPTTVAYHNSAEFARHVRAASGGAVPVAVFHREPGPGVVYANIGASWRQPGPLDAVLVSQHLPDGVVQVHDSSFYSALQPRPGAGRGVVLAALLPGGVDAVYNGDYAMQLHPGTGRGAVFIGPLPDGVVFVNSVSGSFAQQTLPGTGRADGMAGALHVPNLGAGYDGSVVLADGLGPVYENRGRVAEHLRRLLPFAGIGACSVAVNGLAAGPGSLAVAFHLFVLLLGGLFLVILHVLRV